MAVRSATGMPIGGQLLESVGYEKTWTVAFAINLLIVRLKNYSVFFI